MLFQVCFTIGNAQNEKLLGDWQGNTNGLTVLLQIVSSTDLIYDGEVSSYSVEGNVIRVLDEDGYYYDYPFVLQNDQLLLSFPDGYDYTFKRVKSLPQTTQPVTVTEVSKSTQALYGNLCSFSSSSGGGSSYSSTRRLYFDGKGRFSYSTGSSYSGNTGSYYGNNPNALNGRYEVTGKTLTLYYDKGGSETFQINMVQNSGEITELKAGQTFYGKGLCD
ncbi:MAG TPA: hypothetical protein DCX54_04280 [Flavobacteriales bacterium]|nr:hypothetical protein [Flavobacteriales bacterium]